MKVALDANPLAGQRTGVGRYVEQLVAALRAAEGAPELVLSRVSLRGPRLAVPGLREARVRVPMRVLGEVWSRVDVPPIEWLIGRVDVFHATNFAAPPTRRAKLVVTVHDLTYDRYPEWVDARSGAYRVLVPKALARGAVVVCDSATVAAEVMDHYRLPEERVMAAPLGVSSDWFDATPADADLLTRLGLPPRFFLFVGTREPRKNLAWMLHGHREARRTDPAVPPLVLLGPTGWGDVLADVPRDDIVLANYMPDATLRRVVAAAAAVVCTSTYEGFSLPPLEGLAAGTPVIASDIPVHREVLGEAATMVPLDDVEALAEQLSKVAADPNPPPSGREERQAWARGWTWARTATETIEAYRRAASS